MSKAKDVNEFDVTEEMLNEKNKALSAMNAYTLHFTDKSKEFKYQQFTQHKDLNKGNLALVLVIAMGVAYVVFFDVAGVLGFHSDSKEMATHYRTRSTWGGGCAAVFVLMFVLMKNRQVPNGIESVHSSIPFPFSILSNSIFEKAMCRAVWGVFSCMLLV